MHYHVYALHNLGQALLLEIEKKLSTDRIRCFAPCEKATFIESWMCQSAHFGEESVFEQIEERHFIQENKVHIYREEDDSDECS
jgi:hypothetical protein